MSWLLRRHLCEYSCTGKAQEHVACMSCRLGLRIERLVSAKHRNRSEASLKHSQFEVQTPCFPYGFQRCPLYCTLLVL